MLLAFGALLGVFLLTRSESPIHVLGEPGDLSRVVHILEDWRTQPLVSLSVSQDECLEDEEPVFRKIWGGMEEGCFHRDNSVCGGEFNICAIGENEGYVETMENFNARVDYNCQETKLCPR